MKKKFKTAFLIANGILLLFIVGIGGYYVVKFASLAQQGCFLTREQVATDSRCLYIYKTSVYEKGTRSAPHQGHPCGMDVTSILPESHILDKVGHLDPNYKGELCTSASPTTAPTVAPSATPKPTTAPTIAPAATATPEPTVADPFPQNPQNTQAPTSQPVATSLPRTGTTQPAPTATYAPINYVSPTKMAAARPTALPKTGIAQIIPPLTSGLLLLIGIIGILK